MLRFGLLVLVCILSNILLGQGVTSNWYFGLNASFKFENYIPQVTSGSAMSTYYGCSSISDNDGELLYYANPTLCYDQSDQAAYNSNGLIGNDASTVNMAPIIPGLNSHEIFALLKTVKNAGALDAGYIMARLNGPVAEVFSNWLAVNYPNKAEKVLNQIAASHDGHVGDSEFGRRMRGSGKMAEQIRDTFRLARKREFGNPAKVVLNHQAFKSDDGGQMTLF